MVDKQKLYVAMVRDVTERKRFEKEIAADKESLAVTLRSIEDGVITTDVQGKIIMINKAGENLTGWSSREAIGQPLKSVFNIAIDLAAQARAQKSGYRNEAQSILLSMPENATLRSREGTEHIIEQVASPIRDSKNEVAGVVLVFRDITERQRNEAERRKAETLEQLGLLAGGIAHDFNNLLTAIIGNISLASLLLPPDDEMATRLNDAKNASLRARDLAQQLLTFARGGAPIKKTASIGKLIQDTVSFSLRGTHSRSEFMFGADLWPAEIDPGQISQVIANLVVNADQAMPNGGTLRVSCDNFSYDSDTDARSFPICCPAITFGSRSAMKAWAFRKTASSAFSILISRPSRKATVSGSRPRIRSSRITTASSPSNRRSISAPPSPFISLPRGIRKSRSSRRASSTQVDHRDGPHPHRGRRGSDPRAGRIHAQRLRLPSDAGGERARRGSSFTGRNSKRANVSIS